MATAHPSLAVEAIGFEPTPLSLQSWHTAVVLRPRGTDARNRTWSRGVGNRSAAMASSVWRKKEGSNPSACAPHRLASGLAPLSDFSPWYSCASKGNRTLLDPTRQVGVFPRRPWRHWTTSPPDAGVGCQPILCVSTRAEARRPALLAMSQPSWWTALGVPGRSRTVSLGLRRTSAILWQEHGVVYGYCPRQRPVHSRPGSLAPSHHHQTHVTPRRSGGNRTPEKPEPKPGAIPLGDTPSHTDRPAEPRPSCSVLESNQVLPLFRRSLNHRTSSHCVHTHLGTP